MAAIKGNPYLGYAVPRKAATAPTHIAAVAGKGYSPAVQGVRSAASAVRGGANSGGSISSRNAHGPATPASKGVAPMAPVTVAPSAAPPLAAPPTQPDPSGLVANDPTYRALTNDALHAHQAAQAPLTSLLNALQYRDPSTGLTQYEAYQAKTLQDTQRQQRQAMAALAARGILQSGESGNQRQQLRDAADAALADASRNYGAQKISQLQSDLQAEDVNYNDVLEGIRRQVMAQLQQQAAPAGGGGDQAAPTLAPAAPAAVAPKLALPPAGTPKPVVPKVAHVAAPPKPARKK